jgi:sialate O-acetylesterase
MMKLEKITPEILARSLPALVLAIGQLIANSALADVRLPKLLGDHMVLQRDSKIAIWGWADPGESVRIDFHGRRVTTRTHQNGRWSTTLGPFPAGGPCELVIVGKNRITIHDVLVGDVWVASGQSNMEFPLADVVNSEQEVADSNYPQLRLFKVHQRVAFRPVDDVEADTWTASTAKTVANFSAVAFLFGRELHLRYHIPIGLIETSWGGTVAEVWASAEGLRSFPEFGNDIRAVHQADDRSVRAEKNRYVKL